MNIKSTVLFCILIFTMIFYQYIIEIDKEIFNTLLSSFIPSLLPSILLTSMFLESDGIIYLYNKLKNNKYKQALFYLILIFIIMNLGVPGSLMVIKKLKELGIINKKDKKLINSLGVISFPYVYGICINNISDKTIALWILLSYFFINSLSLLIFKFHLNFSLNLKPSDKGISMIFNKSINSSVRTILVITVTVLLFSSPLFIINLIGKPLNLFISGFIEFSYPCYQLSLLNTIPSYINILLIIMFPSLSILFQIKMLDKDINIFSFITSRLLISLASIASFIIFLYFFYH